MLPLNSTAARVVAEILKNAPLSSGKVDFAWRTAVGPAIARVTRVQLDADGTLHVNAPDRQWASEVYRSSALIATRLNALLGGALVKQIRTHHA